MQYNSVECMARTGHDLYGSSVSAMPLRPDCLAVTVSSDRFSSLYGINDESDDSCLYVITTVGPSTTVC
jgi:hypothetical protein